MAEQQQPGDGKAANAASAARKKKQQLIGVIAALLLISGVGSWALLHFLGAGKAAPAERKDAGAAAAAPAAARSEYLQLEPTFLANFNVDGRQRYLQVALAVKTRDPAALEAMRRHMPLIRNRVVMLLSGEVFEQLQTENGRVQLQRKLLEAIREILQKETGSAAIDQVLFTGFVMT